MPKKIIEDAIIEIHSGDSQKSALDLIAWLKENKLNPAQSSSTTWKISAKACVVCYFRFDFSAGIVTIHPIIGEYASDSVSAEMKDITLANKKEGRYCGEKCHGRYCSYMLKTIFGEKYHDACGNSIIFENPAANEIECIKVLIKMRLDVIKNGKLMAVLPRNFACTG